MNIKVHTREEAKVSNKKIYKKVNITNYFENINIDKILRRPVGSFSIIKSEQYEKIKMFNYRVKELKEIAKYYKIPCTKRKKELQIYLYNYLKLSFYTTKIQKNIRRSFIRKLNKLRGPGYFKRNLCNNPTDFYTLEDIKDIDNNQFISFKDDDGFIYGYDMLSLYTYIKKNKNACNPYNRNPFNEKNSPIKTIKKIIHICNAINIPTNIVIPKETINYSKQIELRALSVFQEIDNLGNYTNSAWLLNLNSVQLFDFIRELYDIWNYRAQLSFNTKIQICPPLGNPFQNIDIGRLNTISNNNLKIIALTIIEKMVKLGATNEFKTLGSYYVLTALTIVSYDASASLPWLYESVVY